MDELFLQILNMSMLASIVIVAVILLRFPLKKAPKSISYSLWSVVLFRLICPFSFESIFSLLPSAKPLPQEILTADIPVINSGIPILDQAVRLPAPIQGDSVNPMQILLFIGAILWIVGVAALVIYSIVSYFRLKHKMSTALLIEGNIYECEAISSPFVLGMIKPKIYLPLGLSAIEREYILRHEQTHIKRLDTLVKPLAFFVLCIHWFNPLCWLSFVLMSKDMELSCDESVIKSMGSSIKQDYSTSLLTLATERKLLNGSPLAFGESNVKSRIKNVLNYKKPAFWVILVAVIAVVGVSIGLMANPITKNPKPVILPVISLENTKAEINAAFYENGFDFKYDTLPMLTLSGNDDILKVQLSDNFGSSVALEEDYYTYTDNSGLAEKKVYELTKDTSNAVSLPVSRRGSVRDEEGIYYLKNDEGTFVFKLILPIPPAQPSSSAPVLTKADFITSLDDWDALDYDKKLSENCYIFFYNLLSGKSKIEEYNSVVIKDYQISFATPSENPDSYLNFDFTVESSGLDALPPGKYHKVVADIVDCYMWDSMNPPNNDFLGNFSEIEEVNMVANWISSIYVWDCPKFGEVKDEDINVNYLISQYGKNHELLVDDFIKLSKEKFGIEKVDLAEYDGLIIDKAGIKYITPGGIGGSYEYLVTDYSVEGDIATVTVQHYADCNRLIPSHLVAYHIQKSGIWLGYDLLKKSKNAPYRLQKLYS